MGGPCRLQPADGSSLRRAGPAATDNFQVRPFEYDGTTYHSCEHAYQALKFTAASSERRRMVEIIPRVGELDSAHGMRCWNGGQRGAKGAYRKDWDCVKVITMLEVNRAKYAAHADLQADLLATGDAEIVGGKTARAAIHRPAPATNRLPPAARPLTARHRLHLTQGTRRLGASEAVTTAGSTGMGVSKCLFGNSSSPPTSETHA